jgi:hypothetical protein
MVLQGRDEGFQPLLDKAGSVTGKVYKGSCIGIVTFALMVMGKRRAFSRHFASFPHREIMIFRPESTRLRAILQQLFACCERIVKNFGPRMV